MAAARLITRERKDGTIKLMIAVANKTTQRNTLENLRKRYYRFDGRAYSEPIIALG